MYSIDYLIEKFYQAIIILATGEGDARSRLDPAYRCFWHIPLEDYPMELRDHVLWINKMLTRLKGPKGHIIPDNLQRMKNKTASKIADRILRIYFKLAKQYACK